MRVRTGAARVNSISHRVPLSAPSSRYGTPSDALAYLVMLKAAFFDAAGTLFDAREPVGHTYARIAKEHGVDAGDSAVSAGFRRAFASTPGLAFGPGRHADEIRRLEREWWYGLVRKSFAGLGEFDSFDAFFEELFGYFGDPGNWEPLPEAHSVLRRLKDSDLKLGIISNFDA